MTTTTAIVRKHVEVVTRMLLGSRHMRPGVAITGGAVLDIVGRLRLGQMAVASDTDVVHLGFDGDDAGRELADITIFAPRDIGCSIQPGCRLWLSRSGKRAVLLPHLDVRGHFRLSPREVIHVDRKPDNLDAGIQRAQQRLRQLVGCGIDLAGQASVTEMPWAA